MAGYEVVVDKIRQTGKAAAKVAEGLRGAKCSTAVPTGQAKMPGGRCVSKLAAVKQALQDREQTFGHRLDEHSSTMEKAADLYSTHEDAATRDITTAAQPTGGRKAI